MNNNINPMSLWTIFVKNVQSAFKYLEADFGYKCTSTKEPFVIYESNIVYFHLYYESERGEVDLGFGRLNIEDEYKRSYDIGDIIEIVDPSKWKKFMSPHTHDPDEIKGIIFEFANYVKQCKEIIIGDSNYYDNLLKKRKDFES